MNENNVASEKQLMIDELMAYKERLLLALKVSSSCVFELELEQFMYTYIENAEDIFERSSAEILTDLQVYDCLLPQERMTALANYFSHPDDVEVSLDAFRAALQCEQLHYEARMRTASGSYNWCQIDVMPIMKDGVPVKMMGVITSIDQIKRENVSLLEKAKLDSFAGVYNKSSSEHIIRSTLNAARDERHALVILDLDCFKAINDTYGHDYGDRVILALVQSLRQIFRKTDVLGRFGGDEFIILVRDIPSKDFLARKLTAILECDPELGVTKSIGAAVYPEDGSTYEQLFRRADSALYQSKRRRNCYTISGSEAK